MTKQHRLWEWHGTGEGMIGGPTKRQADFTFFGALWEFPEQYFVRRWRGRSRAIASWLTPKVGMR
jgi:hypothetical protein